MSNVTSSKKDTKSIIGTAGVQDILSALSAAGFGAVPAVCIGGVNNSNAQQVMMECSAAPRKSLDGIAVVSAVIAAVDPAAASRDLLGKVITGRIPDAIRAVSASKPLSHNMTNLVCLFILFIILYER